MSPETKNLPSKPGVYIFKNKTGEIIYIGKALSLKHRVKSYFAKTRKDPKTALMVPQIAQIEHIVVNSEFEALLLEAKLIKEHLPKYNLQLKDGKSYLYVAISKETYPRIYLVRRPELENKLLAWFGPFSSSADTQEVLRICRKVFPFRSCKTLPNKPCLYQDLRLCPGVCLPGVNDYKKTIAQIRQLLDGKSNKVLRNLEKGMKEASSKLDFETAQKFKFQFQALQNLSMGWKNIPREKIEAEKAKKELRKILIQYGGLNLLAINKIEGFDVSNLGKEIIVGAMVTFVDGEPEKGLYRIFKIKLAAASTDDPQSIGQIISRRLHHPEWLYPQIILVDGGKTQISAALTALANHNLAGKIAVLGLTKKEEKIIIPKISNLKISGWKTLKLSLSSPALQLLQAIRDESHRFAQKYYKNLHWKKVKN